MRYSFLLAREENFCLRTEIAPCPPTPASLFVSSQIVSQSQETNSVATDRREFLMSQQLCVFAAVAPLVQV